MGQERRGFKWDKGNKRLDIEVNGTLAASFTGGLSDSDGGRITEHLTAVDDDSTNFTIAAADILAGIHVHTSVTGAGTATTDTALNIIAGIPLTANNQSVVSYYINDGDQTVTFAGGTDVTISDTGNTCPANTSAILLWRRTAATTVTCYVLSGGVKA